MVLDDKDRVILSILKKNSRTPLSEMAKTLGMTTTAVKKRVRKLEQAGIIKAYTIMLNENLLNDSTYLHILHVPNEVMGETTKELLKSEGIIHAFYNSLGNTHVFYVFSTWRELPDNISDLCTKSFVSRVEQLV